jgi:hypothetical protein
MNVFLTHMGENMNWIDFFVDIQYLDEWLSLICIRLESYFVLML